LQLIGDRNIGADESSKLYLDADALRSGESATTNPTRQPRRLQPNRRRNPRPAGLPRCRRCWIDRAKHRAGGAVDKCSNSSNLNHRPAATGPSPAARLIEFDGNYQQAYTEDGSLAAVCTGGCEPSVSAMRSRT